MPQTVYNVEIKFKDSKRWEYWCQFGTMFYAIHKAAAQLGEGRQVRVRRVVKTIVWKNGTRINGKA